MSILCKFGIDVQVEHMKTLDCEVVYTVVNYNVCEVVGINSAMV